MTALSIEVLTSWDEAVKIKEQWNELTLQAGIAHPFSSYDFLDCWYRAYCNSAEVRIVLIRKNRDLKTIFPGMIYKEKFKGIPVTSFSLAANWYSPRADIVMAPDDSEAFFLCLRAISTRLPEKIHLIKLWMVQTDSPIDRIIKASKLPGLSPYCANQTQSPGFDLIKGWENYFESRSKKIRYRFRQAEKRAKEMGEVTFEVFSTPDGLSQIIPRLKSLDSKTWQHKNGSGLFSKSSNEAFSHGLLLNFSQAANVIVALLKIGYTDAAYELGVISGNKAFFLKYGYDPVYADCRPGVLIQSYLTRHISTLGVQEIDLGMEQSEEKGHWQTKSPEFNNYWLIRKNTLKGSALLLGMVVNECIKTIKKKQSENPEKE